MRILTRRIYRAFPELDAYDDAQCKRFVRAARASPAVQAVHTITIIFAVLPLLALSAAAIVALTDRYGLVYDGQDFSFRAATIAANLACFPIAAVGPVAGALVRDVLLRRRLRFVLGARGHCPTCQYTLIGLPVSDRSTVLCPECGIEIEVDPSLGELSREGTGRVLIAGKAADAIVFWTPGRRRVLRRVLLALAVLIFGVLPLVAGGYEVIIRRQSAAARRDQASLRAAIAARIPQAAGSAGSSGFDLIAEAVGIMDAQDRPAWRDALESDGSLPYPEFSFLLRPRHIETETFGGESPERNRAAAELARRMIGLYRAAGAFAPLDRLATTQPASIDLSFLTGDPSQIGGLLDPLGQARRIARLNSGRLAVAAAGGDRAEFLAAFESSLAIVRILRGTPVVVYGLTAHGIEVLALSDVRAWLTSPDARPEWIPDLQAVIRRQRTAIDPAGVFEGWRLEQRLTLAWFFSNPSNIRFGSYSPAFRALAAPQAFSMNGPVPFILGSYARNTRVMDGVCRAAADDVVRPFPQRAFAGLPGGASRASPAVATEAAALGLTYGAPSMAEAIARLLDQIAAERAGIDAILAIELYTHEHGGPPASLAALTPGYLAGPPIDPWADAPFRYKRLDAPDALGRRYVLYSVGADGLDGGGDGVRPEAHTPGTDWVVNDPNR